MPLKTQIQEDIKTALRSGERIKLTTLRILLSVIKQREKDTGMKNIFLEKIDSKKPRKKIIKIILEKLGLKMPERKK